jgi:DNA-binding transcriptional regulator YiaG
MEDDSGRYIFMFQDWNMMQEIRIREKETQGDRRVIVEDKPQAKSFGTDLQRIRIQNRMSLVAMASYLKIDANLLSSFEEGTTPVPEETLKKAVELKTAS